MARKRIREFKAKELIIRKLEINQELLLIDKMVNLKKMELPWLKNKLIVKPDQLFGKRKKYGLVLLNADFTEIKNFIKEHMNKKVTVGKTTDKLTHFLVEPFIEHENEYYLSIISKREGDEITFSTKGGIDIENNLDQANKIFIPTLTEIKNLDRITNNNLIQQFIINLYKLFVGLEFTSIEINPFTIVNEEIKILDTVAEVDGCSEQWRDYNFPQEFGKKSFPEEKFIEEIDKDSGASLKLTILNPKGRIWNILSGGGASIIYLDAIANLGESKEIANYGEYGGNPSTEESYQYAKTILSLMTQEKHPEGKVLLIGGGIANFTDIEKTFRGIAKALKEYHQELKKGKISIYVRRGGPNYENGLKMLNSVCKELGLTIQSYGPETEMTKIVELAL